MFTRVKTTAELDNMRISGRILAQILQTLSQKISINMSTKDLADIAATELSALGARAAFLGYGGFPDVICISVNEEIVHGIPKSTKIIKDGDLVGLDFGVIYDGMITDSAITLLVGDAKSKADQQLLIDTEKALYAGIDAVKSGIRTGDIGQAVENSLRPRNYGIVTSLVGHGVGHEVHEDPNIPNVGPARHGELLKTGMTIAIEPMVTLGSGDVILGNDGWTILTRDGSRSAQFEHTVLIQDNDAEILTSLSV